MEESLKGKKLPALLWFALPVLLAAGIFAALNFTGFRSSGGGAGTVGLLYTSDVGGRIDPCG